MIDINRKRTAVVSGNFPEVLTAIESVGFETVTAPFFKNSTNNLEASHVDMQVLRIGRKIILLRENDIFNEMIVSLTEPESCEIYYTDTEPKEFIYPECVKLNIAVFGKTAAANLKHADKKAIEILKESGYSLIHVNQGYAGCSAAVVSDNAIITSDLSIHKAVLKHGGDSLLISPGYIRLCEKYGGFIGGASFKPDEHTLVFIGDVSAHPDFQNIKSFCRNHATSAESLARFPLTDVGSVFIVNKKF